MPAKWASDVDDFGPEKVTKVGFRASFAAILARFSPESPLIAPRTPRSSGVRRACKGYRLVGAREACGPR